MEDCEIKFPVSSFKISNANTNDSEKEVIILDDDDFIQTTLSLFDSNDTNVTNQDNLYHGIDLNNLNNSNQANNESISLIDLTTCDDFDLNDIFLISSTPSFGINIHQNENLQLKKEAILEIKSELDFKNFNFEFNSFPDEILIDDDQSQYVNSLEDNSNESEDALNETVITNHPETTNNQKRSIEYKCSECSKTFNKSYNYKRHVFLHQSKSNEGLKESSFKVNQCPKCDKKIIDRSNFVKHLKICSSESLKIFLLQEKSKKIKPESSKFKCEICEKIFNKKFNFNRHLRVHFINESLNKNPSNEDSVDTENQKCETKIQIFECEICSRKFSTRELVNKHQIKWHLTEHRCKFCTNETIFKEKFDYIKHLNLFHSIRFKFECNYCKKSFRYISQYIQHRQSHLNQTRLADGKKFDDDFECTESMRESIVSTKCKYCGKSFSKSFNLKRHVESVHKNVQNECDVNDEQSFLLNDKLGFECNQKQKLFYQQNKLNFHINKINLKK